jgi:protein-L-isoaspartate(D-aspartate) O-methyltransferase
MSISCRIFPLLLAFGMTEAAAQAVPPALIEQLKPGGRLVIPVCAQWEAQQLLVIDKNAPGATTTRRILGVRFVPLARSKD